MSSYAFSRRLGSLSPILVHIGWSVAIAVTLAACLLGVMGGGPVTSARAEGAATGVWEPLGGPLMDGGRVNALVVRHNFSNTAQGPAYLPGSAGISDTLFALVGEARNGNRTKLYKSIDSATTWTTVFTAPNGSLNQIRTVAVAGELVYLAGNDCGFTTDCIYRSTDGGLSWNGVYTGGNRWYDFAALAINPVAPTTVYAAGAMHENDWSWNGDAIYATTNGGADWAQIYSTTENLAFAALAVNPVTPTILFASGSLNNFGVVLRSQDGGLNWTQVLTAAEVGAWMPVANVNALLIHPLTPTIVYAGAGWGPNVVYRSTDGGDTWSLVNERTHWGGFGLAFRAPDSIYAISDWGGVNVSRAGGITGTWSSVGNINDQGPVLASGAEALYAGSYFRGVVKSLNDGVTWAAANQGIRSDAVIGNIAVDPGNPARMLVGSDPWGWLTNDGGQSWTQPQGAGWPDSFTPMNFAINPADGNNVYAGIMSCSQGAVLRSTDGALTFSPVYTSPVIGSQCTGGNTQINAVAVAPAPGAAVYAAGSDYPDNGNAAYGLIARSLANGVAGSWSEVFTLTAVDFKVVSIDPVNPANVYAGGGAQQCSPGGCPGVLYRTQDAGLSWALVLTDSSTIHSIAINWQNPSVVYAASDNYRVFKSQDGGATWAVVRRPPSETSGNRLAIDPHAPSHVYLGGWGYIGESTNGGATWSEGWDPLNSGAPQLNPGDLAVINNGVTQTLYVGFSGLWQYVRPAPQPGNATTITLASNLVTVTVNNTATLGVLVVDQYGNWVNDETPVTFSSPAVLVTATAPVGSGHAVTTVTMLPPLAAAIDLTVSVENSAGPPTQRLFTLTLRAAAQITSSPGLSAIVGQPYTYTVYATGAPTPTFSLPARPDGMTIDAQSGLLQWTPDAPGSFNVTVAAENGVAAPAQQSFTIVVLAPAQITSSPGLLAVVGQPYTYTVYATGAPTPTFSLPARPDGMTIDAQSGLLQWTPDAPGSFNVTVAAENGVAAPAQQSFTIVVLAPAQITSSPGLSAVVGQPYTYTVYATGAPAPTFSLPARPDGMTIDAQSGLLQWTPDAPGSFNVTVAAENGVAAPAQQSFTIVVGEKPKLYLSILQK